MDNITHIDVAYQPIELCKLLKIANLVGGGGEAKIVILEGYVYVNGEVEFQKRKKIYHQDIIEFNGELVEVSCLTPVGVLNKEKTVKKVLTKNKSEEKANKPCNSKTTTKAPGHRKRISF